jgi:hypothetical protein
MSWSEMPAAQVYSIGWCEVLNMSKSAMIVRYLGEKEWIPYSQIAESSDLNNESVRGDEGEMIVTDWLARQREWI